MCVCSGMVAGHVTWHGFAQLLVKVLQARCYIAFLVWYCAVERESVTSGCTYYALYIIYKRWGKGSCSLCHLFGGCIQLLSTSVPSQELPIHCACSNFTKMSFRNGCLEGYSVFLPYHEGWPVRIATYRLYCHESKLQVHTNQFAQFYKKSSHKIS